MEFATTCTCRSVQYKYSIYILFLESPKHNHLAFGCILHDDVQLHVSPSIIYVIILQYKTRKCWLLELEGHGLFQTSWITLNRGTVYINMTKHSSLMFKATACGLLKFTTTKIPSSAYLVIWSWRVTEERTYKGEGCVMDECSLYIYEALKNYVHHLILMKLDLVYIPLNHTHSKRTCIL